MDVRPLRAARRRDELRLHPHQMGPVDDGRRRQRRGGAPRRHQRAPDLHLRPSCSARCSRPSAACSSAARLATASQQAGTGDVNLNAIAAAVIGGTSLFGGRGSAWSALLGIIVIQSISNGLTLLNLSSSLALHDHRRRARHRRDRRQPRAPEPRVARPRLIPEEASERTTLKGKVAAVTGAASGIGLACAQAMLAAGAKRRPDRPRRGPARSLCAELGAERVPLVVDLTGRPASVVGDAAADPRAGRRARHLPRQRRRLCRRRRWPRAIPTSGTAC